MKNYLTGTIFLLVSFVTGNSENEEFNNSEYTNDHVKIRQGDMIFQEDADPSRKIVDAACRKWSDGKVPYVNKNLPASQFAVMLTAMKTWEKHTCVRFQDISGNSELQKQQHVRIKAVNNGCYSHVGRICSTRVGNEIGMARGCTRTNGTPVHELGHTLGLYHEQSRPDRDNFVTIVKNNIISNTLSNFEIARSSDTFSVQYDYYSVMHYPRNGFSKNGQNTIITKNAEFQNVIGRRIGPSFADIRTVNIAYNCAKNCDSSIKCRLETCIVNQNCKCVCPDKAPKTGQYSPADDPVEESPSGAPTVPAPPTTKPPPTTTPSPATPSCGGSFSLTSVFSYVLIRPPKTAGKYVNNARCVWTITNNMKSSSFRRLRFYLFSLDLDSNQSSCGDYIMVNKKGDNNFSGLEKICGRETGFRPTTITVSDGNQMSVLFESDGSGSGRGFSAIVRATR